MRVFLWNFSKRVKNGDKVDNIDKFDCFNNCWLILCVPDGVACTTTAHRTVEPPRDSPACPRARLSAYMHAYVCAWNHIAALILRSEVQSLCLALPWQCDASVSSVSVGVWASWTTATWTHTSTGTHTHQSLHSHTSPRTHTPVPLATSGALYPCLIVWKTVESGH